MDVEITPATDPTTVAVLESSVNVGAKAKISVWGSVCLTTVPLLTVFIYSCLVMASFSYLHILENVRYAYAFLSLFTKFLPEYYLRVAFCVYNLPF